MISSVCGGALIQNQRKLVEPPHLPAPPAGDGQEADDVRGLDVLDGEHVCPGLIQTKLRLDWIRIQILVSTIKPDVCCCPLEDGLSLLLLSEDQIETHPLLSLDQKPYETLQQKLLQNHGQKHI